MYRNLSPRAQGVLWIILAKTFFMIMMTFVKYLHHFPSMELNFFRGLLVLTGATFLIFRNKDWKKILTSQTPYVHLCRVVLSVSSMILLFYGYRALPLAKASALNYTYALTLPFFSILLLKEHVGALRWIALGIGYMGVLLILNPLYDGIHFPELAILLGVVLLSISGTLSKKLTSRDSLLSLVFYSGLGTVIALGLFYGAQSFSLITCPTDLQWVMPRMADLSWLGGLGLIAFIGHWSYLKAFQKGRLNFYAGFDYLKVIWGVAIGIVVFNELPTWPVLAGGLIILAINIAITVQELRYKE